jgi:hypothetical protein
MRKLAIGIFIFLSVFIISCSDDENNSTVPVLTTTSITNITNNSATSGGVVTSDGGANITARGVVWSTSQNPTIELSTKTVEGTGTGSFTSSITGLLPNTTYYVRAYATNSVGTSYGNNGINFIFTTDVDVTTGLVAYYPFNGNANDASGNSNHGTVQGNVTLATDRFGNSNKAYSFPGNPNSFIDCGNNPTIQIRGALSLSAWIYMDGGSLNPRILQYHGSGTSGGYTAFVDGTSNSSRVLHATNYNDNRTGTGFCCGSAQGFSLPALSWQHFVYTASATGLAKMYINGNLVGEQQGVPVTNITYANTLNIGKLPGGSDAWGGKLDEIRIYNRVLNTAEISYLYQN